MKKSFSKQGFKSLITTVTRLVSLGNSDCKVLLEKQASLFWEIMYRYQWLKFMSDHDDIINVERRSSLSIVYDELVSLCDQVPGLKDYDMSKGNPIQVLTEALAIDLSEAQKEHPNERCAKVTSMDLINYAVVRYNFSHENEDVLPDMFMQAEKTMMGIAKENRWAARGSWNATVDKTLNPTEKKKRDMSFLKFFKSPVNEAE